MRRRTALIVILILLIALLLLAIWLIRMRVEGPTLLIYGEGDTGHIAARDLQADSSTTIFADAAQPDSNYYWSPTRESLLRVSLEPQAEGSAFVFALFPRWQADPIVLADPFDGYSTPQWSPDGRQILFSACRQASEDAICNTFDFYLLNVETQTLDPMPLIGQDTRVSDYLWDSDTTLLLWVAMGVLRLDISSGEITPLVSDLPGERRAVQWSADLSRLAYVTGESGPCLYVLALGEGSLQEVTCGIRVQDSFGWLGDGKTVFYLLDEEIRLYNSEAQTDRSAAQPAHHLDWRLDYVYALPATHFIMHHATFDDEVLNLIDAESGQVQTYPFRLDRPMSDGGFFPAPQGLPVAVLMGERDRLGLFRPSDDAPQWIYPVACCTVAWSKSG